MEGHHVRDMLMTVLFVLLALCHWAISILLIIWDRSSPWIVKRIARAALPTSSWRINIKINSASYCFPSPTMELVVAIIFAFVYAISGALLIFSCIRYRTRKIWIERTLGSILIIEGIAGLIPVRLPEIFLFLLMLVIGGCLFVSPDRSPYGHLRPLYVKQ
jgi:hypothetical protein